MYKSINCLMSEEFPEFPGNSVERELLLSAENFYSLPDIPSILSVRESNYGKIGFDPGKENLKRILKNDKIYNYLYLRHILMNPSIHFYYIRKGKTATILYISPFQERKSIFRLTPQEFSFSGYRFKKRELENYNFNMQFPDHLFDFLMRICNLTDHLSPCRKSEILY